MNFLFPKVDHLQRLADLRPLCACFEDTGIMSAVTFPPAAVIEGDLGVVCTNLNRQTGVEITQEQVDKIDSAIRGVDFFLNKSSPHESVRMSEKLKELKGIRERRNAEYNIAEACKSLNDISERAKPQGHIGSLFNSVRLGKKADQTVQEPYSPDATAATCKITLHWSTCPYKRDQIVDCATRAKASLEAFPTQKKNEDVTEAINALDTCLKWVESHTETSQRLSIPIAQVTIQNLHSPSRSSSSSSAAATQRRLWEEEQEETRYKDLAHNSKIMAYELLIQESLTKNLGVWFTPTMQEHLNAYTKGDLSKVNEVQEFMNDCKVRDQANRSILANEGRLVTSDAAMNEKVEKFCLDIQYCGKLSEKARKELPILFRNLAKTSFPIGHELPFNNFLGCIRQEAPPVHARANPPLEQNLHILHKPRWTAVKKKDGKFVEGMRQVSFRTPDNREFIAEAKLDLSPLGKLNTEQIWHIFQFISALGTALPEHEEAFFHYRNQRRAEAVIESNLQAILPVASLYGTSESKARGPEFEAFVQKAHEMAQRERKHIPDPELTPELDALRSALPNLTAEQHMKLLPIASDFAYNLQRATQETLLNLAPT